MPDKPVLPENYRWLVRLTDYTGEVHVSIAFRDNPHIDRVAHIDRVTMTPDFINKHTGVGQERFDKAILTVMNQMAAKLHSRLDIAEWVKKWQ